MSRPQISTWSPAGTSLTTHHQPQPSRPIIPLSVLNDRMSAIDLPALAIAKVASPPSSASSSSASSSLSSSPFDSVLSRWQKLTVDQQQLMQVQVQQVGNGTSALSNGGGQVYSESGGTRGPSAGYRSDFELEPKAPSVISFAPRTMLRAGSPTSSSEDGPILLSSVQKDALFFATRSRVVRVENVDSFLSMGAEPVSVWERGCDMFAVFGTHNEAAASLALSGPSMQLATALHTDLEPFHSLRRCNLALSLQPQQSAMSQTATEYTLSSNPPNPKTSFRLGDWICASPKCAAHNFGRNLACIGCGCPRSLINQNPSSSNQQLGSPSPSTSRALPSPRFNAAPTASVTYYTSGPSSSQTSQPPQTVQHPPIGSGYASQPQPPPSFGSSSPSSPLPHLPAKSAHPLLTPSGRAFAAGGKVQNISSDPLNPCIMYWPDNEPLPEQGQIRPSGLVGVAQPPILNTGNRGPISHQPGDWVCQKCNYLNWRRRKVCQTCLPYAEGNGDSISAAVQAERIALLTSVLSHTQLGGGNGSPMQPHHHQQQQQTPRSHSLTPPQAHARRPFIDISPPNPHHPSHAPSNHPHHSHNTLNKPVYRSQSHYALGQQYAAQAQQIQSPHPQLLQHPSSAGGYLSAPSPIYQTSPQQHPHMLRQPSPLYSTGPPDMMRTRDLGLSPGFGNGSGSVVGSGFGASLRIGSGPSGANACANGSSAIAAIGGHPHHHPYTREHQVSSVPLPLQAPAPAPLLPSFLQDMVQSPTLSPTSTTTSSAELSSVEEYDDLASPLSLGHGGHGMFPRARGDSGSSAASRSSLLGMGAGVSVDAPSAANIWRLDGEETKSLSVGPRVLLAPIGVGRKTSREGL